MRLVILIILLSHSVFADTGFKYIKGKVTVNDKLATKDTKLHVNDIVKVSKSSLAVIYIGKKGNLKVSENSTLKIESIAEDQKASSFILEAGSLFSKVFLKSKTKKSIFNVRTKSAAMGVRGTEFFVAYGRESEKENVWMCVEEGIVDVTTSANKKVTSVKAGEGIFIKNGRDVTAPKKYAWTKKLNWNLDSSKGDLENNGMDDLYQDLLDQDYD